MAQLGEIFHGDGLSRMQDGSILAYDVYSFESGKDLYDVRIYRDDARTTLYFHNSRNVDTLPNTPGTRKLLASLREG